MDQTLYKELILDLSRNPLNKGILPDFDVSHRDFNTSCGDDVTIYLKHDAEGKVSEISHDGIGCAISSAATSLLTEWVKGKTKEEIAAFTKEDMTKMLGITISHTREGCALLGWKTVRHIALAV